jgi:hypothetical protein
MIGYQKHIHKAKQKAKRLSRRPFEPLIEGFLRIYSRKLAQNYDISQSIAIASCPRGGSTWLAEIVATLPGYSLLWEPLEPAYHRQIFSYGFGYDDYVAPGTRDERKREYLRQVLSGEYLNLRYFNGGTYFQIGNFLRPCGYVAKFVRGNLLFYWMLQEFNIKGILLIRHPCATVASQLHFGAWQRAMEWSTKFIPFLEMYDPGLIKIYQSLSTIEEVLAFHWVIRTLIPLREPGSHPWLLVAYEKLMIDVPGELTRIFDYLGYPIPRKAHRQTRIASSTTKSYGNLDATNQLTRWKHYLTSKQISAILQVVYSSGADFYDEDIHPKYECLGLEAP